MITQSPDTHPEIERVMISLIQNASIAKRISRLRSLSETSIKLSRRAIMRANPGLDKEELNYKFISFHYGKKLETLFREYMKSRSL